MRAIFLNTVAISALVLMNAVASAQGVGGERGGAERGGGASAPAGGMERGGAPGAGAERGGNAGANAPKEGMTKEGAGAEGAAPKKGAESTSPKQGAGTPATKQGAAETPNSKGAEGAKKQESSEKGTENGNGKKGAEATKNGQGGSGRAANISPAQKTKVSTTIHTRIQSEHVENIRNVTFAVNVGTVVPTRYHYYPLPPEVIEIVPEYRGYDFIYVNDVILILDPGTHEIVYIL